MCQVRSKDNLFALGARDAEQLSNTQVCGGDRLYILKTHCARTVFGFQQRTNMETNKGADWLGTIRSVTTKPCGKRMVIR